MTMPPWVSLTPGKWPATNPVMDLSPGTWWRFHGNSYTDDGLTLAVENDAVKRVVDLSGNGRHLTQSTPGARPLYKTDVLNGKSIGRFDSTDDTMSGAFTTASARTVFIVAKKQNAVNATVEGLLTQSSGTALLYAHNAGGGGIRYSRNQAGAEVTIGGTPTNPFILEMVYASASSVTPVLNGVAGTAFDPNDAYDDTATVHVGSDTGVGSFGDWDVAEIIFFPTEISSDDRAVVRELLGEYYGIAI